MTRDEIMSLTPEQIRVEVAKVLGFVKLDYPDDDAWGIRVDDPKYPGCQCFQQKPLPDWPADIAAAWELVDNNDIDFTIHHFVYSDGPITWVASIHPGRGAKSIYAEEPTAPMAICRAWLLWQNGGNS
jgi:hypothetical protein